jgi:predicted acyltransferase
MSAADNRLLSLDVFRGLTIAAMILVNTPGSWSYVYSPLLHAKWNGVTPTDVVFPFFLFIVGVSIAFALRTVKSQYDRHNVTILRILKRGAILFLIGLFLNAFPYFNLAEIRIPGVLQRIAIVFCIAAVLFLKTSWRTQTVVSAVLLIVYWLLLTQVPVPGVGPANLERGTNLAAWVDSQLLMGHMWPVTGTWDPEGVLSTVPAIVTCLIGLLAGQWMQTARSAETKLLHVFVAANVLLLIGWIWSLVFPFNKSLWTSSYVLYTGGLALHMFAVLYWWLDVQQRGHKIFLPFKIYGVNAIAAYTLSMLGASLLNEIHVGEATLQDWLYHIVVAVIPNLYDASLLFAILFNALIFLPIWFLYKRNILIKV